MSKRWAFGAGLCSIAALLALPNAASAEVRREGTWDDDDPAVTLDLDNVPRAEALNRLAAAAGWSLVVNAPKGDPVSVHVKKLPASKLLDVLLGDGRYVARRDKTLVSITPDTASEPPVPQVPHIPPVPPAPPVPAAPPVPPVPPAPSASDDSDEPEIYDTGGRDRFVTGHNLRIEANETVGDVTVAGGNVDVYGTVDGDLSVAGGNAYIHKGARVRGDASATGGNLHIESGASVDGDVGVFGGNLEREEGAYIGGDVHEGIHKERRHDKHAKASKAKTKEHAEADKPESDSKSLARRAADAINGAALLFVFGAVLLALAPDRMDQLKLQIASRPMRSFATGVVSFFAGIALFCAVCITVIGIPVALIGLLALILATLAGLCSVLETVGAALLGHRTRNPYVHLAFGGLVFLLVGAIPHFGDFVKLAAVLTALGSVVTTRAAGLFPEQLRRKREANAS